MRHDPTEERELEKLQTDCRNLVRAVEEGKRDDVPERAVELARFIAFETERTRPLMRECSQAKPDYHMGEIRTEELEEAEHRFEQAFDYERERTLDAIAEFTELVVDQPGRGA